MILYNITFCTEPSVKDEFVRFLMDTVIPATENAGLYGLLLTEVRQNEIHRQAAGDDNACSLALQMRASSEEMLDAFKQSIMPAVFETIGHRWRNKVLMFDTELDIIHKHK